MLAQQTIAPRREPFCEHERRTAEAQQEDRDRKPVGNRAAEMVLAVEAETRAASHRDRQIEVR